MKTPAEILAKRRANEQARIQLIRASLDRGEVMLEYRPFRGKPHWSVQFTEKGGRLPSKERRAIANAMLAYERWHRKNLMEEQKRNAFVEAWWNAFHENLDRAMAQMIAEKQALPSQTSVLELMEFAVKKAKKGTANVQEK